MNNLLRIEINKLLKNKAYIAALSLFLISVSATFIGLGLSPGFVDGLIEEAIGLIPVENGEVLELLDELLAVKDKYQMEEIHFPQFFYLSSSGHYILIMLFTTIYIFVDFLKGTIVNPLLCGYTRSSVYLSKLCTSYLGGACYLTASMIMVFIIGIFIYRTPFNADQILMCLLLLAAQLVVLLEHVAVCCAFSFIFANGWSIAACIVFFGVLPAIPLAIAMLQNADHSTILTYLPCYFTTMPVGNFATLEQMIAFPQLWSAGYLIPVLAMIFSVSALFTLLGMQSFAKRRL